MPLTVSLVTLKEPSSFIIEKEADMPILDGAEACYPVYSAIAKAVYKDIDSLERQYQIDYQYTNGKIVTFTNTSIGYLVYLMVKLICFLELNLQHHNLKKRKVQV